MQYKGAKKRELLLELERGIAKAGNCVDDHKLLKSSICLLSEQFLHNSGTASKRIPMRRGVGTSNDSDKLLAIQKKTGTLQCAMEKRRRMHKKEMQRLRKEQSVLTKVRKPAED